MTQAGEHRFRILLIEDNPADVELLRRAFASAKLDCDLTLLEDGAEALAFLRRLETQSDEPSPDLTVLDLNLPKNDGVEVLQAMRASPAFASMPVAVLSSSPFSRERARIEPYRIGRYITKPADLDEFLKIGFILKELLTADGDGPSEQGLKS
jgi:chemotaxis family two-component system response regulator Rcp1